MLPPPSPITKGTAALTQPAAQVVARSAGFVSLVNGFSSTIDFNPSGSHANRPQRHMNFRVSVDLRPWSASRTIGAATSGNISGVHASPPGKFSPASRLTSPASHTSFCTRLFAPAARPASQRLQCIAIPDPSTRAMRASGARCLGFAMYWVIFRASRSLTFRQLLNAYRQCRNSFLPPPQRLTKILSCRARIISLASFAPSKPTVLIPVPT